MSEHQSINETDGHVSDLYGAGIFEPVVYPSGGKLYLKPDSAAYTAFGGRIEMVKTWKEIAPGVFLTGNDVPRIYRGKNYPAALKRVDAKGMISPDTIAEDMSMVIAMAQGLVVTAAVFPVDINFGGAIVIDPQS